MISLPVTNFSEKNYDTKNILQVIENKGNLNCENFKILITQNLSHEKLLILGNAPKYNLDYTTLVPGHVTHERVGRGSDREGHWSIWAGVVSS